MTATRAPALSLADLAARWHDCVRAWREAHERGASEVELLRYEAAVNRAERRHAAQKRRIELAVAGDRGWIR